MVGNAAAAADTAYSVPEERPQLTPEAAFADALAAVVTAACAITEGCMSSHRNDAGDPL